MESVTEIQQSIQRIMIDANTRGWKSSREYYLEAVEKIRARIQAASPHEIDQISQSDDEAPEDIILVLLGRATRDYLATLMPRFDAEGAIGMIEIVVDQTDQYETRYNAEDFLSRDEKTEAQNLVPAEFRIGQYSAGQHFAAITQRARRELDPNRLGKIDRVLAGHRERVAAAVALLREKIREAKTAAEREKIQQDLIADRSWLTAQVLEILRDADTDLRAAARAVLEDDENGN